MFYNNQPQNQQDEYKKMLTIMGNLTYLFSESNCPYLPYRAHENIFCKYFKADNLGRLDCSADAKKNSVGIGLKTWMGTDDQKVAEFGKLRETFADLSGLALVKKIAEYRNERIRVTMAMHDINEMIYHIVKRIPGAMQICEYAFTPIDIENIKLIKNRGNVNNTYFTDGTHTYHFSTSKNTLYMIFENMEILETFEVEIMNDPYDFLMNEFYKKDIKKLMNSTKQNNKKEQICLRLYSSNNKKGKFVPAKSGLNQWNASGRKRNPNEVYISYPIEDRRITSGFFPPRETPFTLHFPDNSITQAMVCQSDGKAIMTNPNKILGEWLLRKVFNLKEGTLITYEMLEKFGIDCVIFSKNSESDYSIDFGEIGTYEEYIDSIGQKY